MFLVRDQFLNPAGPSVLGVSRHHSVSPLPTFSLSISVIGIFRSPFIPKLSKRCQKHLGPSNPKTRVGQRAAPNVLGQAIGVHVPRPSRGRKETRIVWELRTKWRGGERAQGETTSDGVYITLLFLSALSLSASGGDMRGAPRRGQCGLHAVEPPRGDAVPEAS